MAGVKTGDTLCDPKNILKLAGVDFPKPCLSMAVKVSKKGEEEKVAAGLTRLMEEDPTITFALNKETREQVLSGLGEQHLDVIVSKLKNKFGVDVTLELPKVAYRETIRKRGRGTGQAQEAVRRSWPIRRCLDKIRAVRQRRSRIRNRGSRRSRSENYFPAVEKGLRDCVAKDSRQAIRW